MARKYLITFTHHEMPSDYTGSRTLWANDEKQAISYLLVNRPDKNNSGNLKKGGARVTIKEIYEVPTPE